MYKHFLILKPVILSMYKYLRMLFITLSYPGAAVMLLDAAATVTTLPVNVINQMS